MNNMPKVPSSDSELEVLTKTNLEPKSVFLGFFLNSAITKSLLMESNLARCAAISARLFNLLSVIVERLEDNNNFNWEKLRSASLLVIGNASTNCNSNLVSLKTVLIFTKNADKVLSIL